MSRAKTLFRNHTEIEKPTTVNREGYPAYQRPLKEQYLQTLLCNTLGNTFYATQDELLKEAAALHDEMLREDPEFAAKALVFARTEGFMRLQPTFGLAKLSGVRPDLFRRAFDRVILIPSDLQDFFVILKNFGRGQGGRAIKKAVAKWLNERLSEYWVIKYGGNGRGFSLSDIARVVHPKPVGGKQSALFAYLRGRQFDESSLPQIALFEQFKRAKTAQERAQLIREGKLPHEVVTGVGGLDHECWRALVAQLPLMALLRNLNTLERHEVLEEARDLITSRFADAKAIRNAKIFPFRFLQAYLETDVAWVRDALRQAVELTVANVPEVPGKTAIFLDVSGSMGSTGKGGSHYLLIGAVFALSLFKKTNGNNCVFWLFNDDVQEFLPSMYDSILTQAERLRAGGGTATGAPMRRLLKKRIFVDNIILITDEQQNLGSLFYTNLVLYRREVNPNAKCFVIDVSPYHSAVAPPTDLQTYFVYGWSDRVLQYISLAARGFGGFVDAVEQVVL